MTYEDKKRQIRCFATTELTVDRLKPTFVQLKQNKCWN